MPSFNFSQSCFSGEKSLLQNGRQEREGGGDISCKWTTQRSLLVINRRFKKPSSAKRCINAYPPPLLSLFLLPGKVGGKKKSLVKIPSLYFIRIRLSIIFLATPPLFLPKKRRHLPNWIWQAPLRRKTLLISSTNRCPLKASSRVDYVLFNPSDKSRFSWASLITFSFLSTASMTRWLLLSFKRRCWWFAVSKAIKNTA